MVCECAAALGTLPIGLNTVAVCLAHAWQLCQMCMVCGCECAEAGLPSYCQSVLAAGACRVCNLA
jgi:hypothetical protein